MDLIPMPDGARPLIKGYGDGGFRVGAVRIEGAVLVTEAGTARLALTETAALDARLGAEIAAHHPEVLIVGTGADTHALPAPFADAVRSSGIAIEPMATGPACRTFNVLVGDGRAVAALLLPID